ncbi:cation:proton antiporter [Streptomyces sp. NBC_01476]
MRVGAASVMSVTPWVGGHGQPHFAAALTVVMNVAAGLLVARLYGYGPRFAAEMATTLLARGEFALILAAMATGAGLDDRLAPFIAGYVLVLAVLGPVAAGRADLPARALRAVGAWLPSARAPAGTAPGDRGRDDRADQPAQADQADQPGRRDRATVSGSSRSPR